MGLGLGIGRKVQAALAMASGLAMAACGAGGTGPQVDPGDLREEDTNVLFLHHSTGERIWDGGVPAWFDSYNAEHGTHYRVVEKAYPDKPHPWSNDPIDYWRTWVDHSGEDQYKKQPTLDQIVAGYDVVVWKHCFLGSHVAESQGAPSASSKVKSVDNYKAQYADLKTAMRRFPDTQFLVWTLPPLVEADTNPGEVTRAEEFTTWVRESWDEPGDNIHLFDFRAIAAKDGLLPAEYAEGTKDSHPSRALATKAAPLFAARIVDVIEGRADTTAATGEGTPAPSAG